MLPYTAYDMLTAMSRAFEDRSQAGHRAGPGGWLRGLAFAWQMTLSVRRRLPAAGPAG